MRRNLMRNGFLVKTQSTKMLQLTLSSNQIQISLDPVVANCSKNNAADHKNCDAYPKWQEALLSKNGYAGGLMRVGVGAKQSQITNIRV